MPIIPSDRRSYSRMLRLFPIAAILAASIGDAFAGFDGTLSWRFVGPMLGGRVNAVVGHPDERAVAYAGYTGGGVWKTTNAGGDWFNVSDGYFRTGSVGAIGISRSDPEILYVGTGEHALRGDVSHGDGVYKTTDGGKSWTHLGLVETRQISRVIVHPRNPNIVYVAALGHFAGPNPERGVYRTKDGGETWERILFQDDDSGVIDLEMDRSRPDLMYAATWEVRRFPWGIRSGGEGSRIYRSRDGGDTWDEITNHPGMPEARVRERIGLTLTEAKEGRVYALISSDAGKGLYRSDDGGDTWQFLTDDVRLFARAYYYMHIIADPSLPDRVYVAAEELFRSDDGGKTFEDINRDYSDHHDLWIDPEDSNRLIDGQDHGALLSYNGGASYSPTFNQPTAQVYTLTTDKRFPFWLYGNVQDWGSYKVSSRPRGGRNGVPYEYRTANSEGGYTVMDPADPNILYISNHHWMHRVDQDADTASYISPSDELHYGWGTADQQFRFFWVFPILRSAHSGALYAGSQYVHRSTDEGHTWKVISPDLTAAEPETLEKTPLLGRDTSDNGPYWGPLTRDSNGDNWNATLYTMAESPRRGGLIWTGSDDGRVHVTKDDGRSWRDVTPPDLPPRTIVARIEASPFDEAAAYFTAMRYKVDDLAPYIYRTDDFGESWTKITNGIAADDFTRVLRADTERRGLLFAGTETGVYYSLDDGAMWTRFESNLPYVPVHDMQIEQGDLAIATHGRGFWILDDVSVFRQMSASTTSNDHLYRPRDAVRYRPLHGESSLASPQAHGVVVNYNLASADSEVSLRFLDADGSVIAAFDEAPDGQGLRRFIWEDPRHPGAEELEGHPTRSNRNIGPYLLPGDYTVELAVNGDTSRQSFSLVPDPNSEASTRDLEAQFEFVTRIRDTITDINRTVLAIRRLREQLHSRAEAARSTALQPLDERLYRIESALTAYDAEYRMQYHAIPVRLDDKLYTLAGRALAGDRPPTRAQRQLFDEFLTQYEDARASLRAFIDNDLVAYNHALVAAGQEPIPVPERPGRR